MVATMIFVGLSATVSIYNIASAEYYFQIIEAIIVTVAAVFTFCTGFGEGYKILDCMTILAILSAIVLAAMFHMIVFAVTLCIMIVLLLTLIILL